jgi:hypothetical protein
MGLFSGKPKVSTSDFCQDFYDNRVFKATIAGVDMNDVMFNSFFDSVVKADSSFAVVDKSVFAREITALRLELFALAWKHKFTHDKYQVPQSIFTWKYLVEHGQSVLWDIMGEYNYTIAEAESFDRFGNPIGGRIGRASAVASNSMRMDISKGWMKRVDAGEFGSEQTKKDEALKAVVRVINRLMADVNRADSILIRRLTTKFAYRLNCPESMSSEGIITLGGIVLRLYRGSVEALKDVSLLV